MEILKITRGSNIFLKGDLKLNYNDCEDSFWSRRTFWEHRKRNHEDSVVRSVDTRLTNERR